MCKVAIAIREVVKADLVPLAEKNLIASTTQNCKWLNTVGSLRQVIRKRFQFEAH